MKTPRELWSKYKNKKKEPKERNYFTRVCVTCLCCILLICTGFMFLVFRTNSIYAYSEKTIQEARYLHETQIHRLHQSAKDLMSVVGDGVSGPVDGDLVDGVDGFKYDREVFDKLSNSSYASRAEAYSYVYAYVNEKYGYAAAVGIMANVWAEGDFGLVQYDMTVPNWDGTSSATSTRNSPLFVKTKENIDAIDALGNSSSNDVGTGICQWTWYTYVKELAQHYRDNLGDDNELSHEELVKAEMEMFADYVDKHDIDYTDDPGECARLWCKYGESGGEDKPDKEAPRIKAAKELDKILKQG